MRALGRDTRKRAPAIVCIALAGIAFVCYGVRLRALSVSLTGVPSPPTCVTLGTTYYVTTAAIPHSGYTVGYMEIQSSAGDSTGPYGPFVKQGSLSFLEDCGATKAHTWSVVNQAAVYEWYAEYAESGGCNGSGGVDDARSNGQLGWYGTGVGYCH
jgi:hypothetical protein